MPCRKCQINPRAHSFQLLGTLQDTTTRVYYTSPRLALEPEDSPEAVEYYLEHFKETRPNPWIWVFDCQGMKSRDLILSGVGKRLAEALQKNYIDTLKGVYVIHPTWAMKTFLTFILRFITKESASRIHICSLGPLDVMQRFQALGLSQQGQQAFLKVIQ